VLVKLTGGRVPVLEITLIRSAISLVVSAGKGCRGRLVAAALLLAAAQLHQYSMLRLQCRNLSGRMQLYHCVGVRCVRDSQDTQGTVKCTAAELLSHCMQHAAGHLGTVAVSFSDTDSLSFC
jgi:hypothetical protein